jgi:GH15 family glucan-1,4-alpha-glucosidase
VTLDASGRVRDVYFPHVGLEDHVRTPYLHRVGVWADGSLAWLGDEGWVLDVQSEPEALASRIVAKHERLGVELRFTDIVYNEKNIFVRSIAVINASDRSRDIRLFFGHEFEIYKSPLRDTAYYDPLTRSVIHYKGRRVFLVSASLDNEPFQDYTTGVSGFQDKEGSFRDAEDGALSKNAIEHGPVDSVIGLYGHYEPRQERHASYWMVAAESIEQAHELHAYVLERTAEKLVRTATDFWRAWVDAYDWHLQGLSDEHVALFKRSLMLVRAHVDRGGGIIASLDSDMLQYGKDNYTYVWPRDGAYIALALDIAGDTNVAKRFFQFAAATITPEGYMMHKYLPDRSLGSSWHPWVRNGAPALPIQEDETALPIFALGEHYRHSRDVEFLESMYNPLVRKGTPRRNDDIVDRLSEITFNASLIGEMRAIAFVSRLVREGRIPAAVVAGNPEFLRPMVGAQPRGGPLAEAVAARGPGAPGRARRRCGRSLASPDATPERGAAPFRRAACRSW